MLSFLQEIYGRLEAIPIRPENERRLRDGIQQLLTLSHLCAGGADRNQRKALSHLTQGCHQILRRLENLLLCHARGFLFEPCDLAIFLDDICCACDLLLSGCNKRLLFDATAPWALAACAPGPVRCAVLNLIANAARYSQAGTILVRLACTASHALITVRSAGEASLTALQRGTDTAGSGLCAVRRCVELHHGTLLFQSDGGGTLAALALPRDLEAQPDLSPLPQPDFVEYVCDRLSPVYTGLSGLCPCPV